MRCFWISSLILLASSSLAWSQELTFKSYGKEAKNFSLVELENLVPPKKINVIEPHESVQREYLGFAVNDVLNAVYGKNWKKAEEILFTCSDGYQPSIPVSRFKKYKGYLVFKRTDSNKFTVRNKLQNNEVVALGPYYLIWDNKKDAYLKMLGASDWPYQVTTFDLIKFADHFPKMAPPPASSASVKRGFEGYREFCMTCHMVNGEGGSKAMDLNSPKSVTEYHDEVWLKKWISDPTRIRPETRMPALNRNLPDRDKLITDIITYLKAMASERR